MDGICCNLSSHIPPKCLWDNILLSKCQSCLCRDLATGSYSCWEDWKQTVLMRTSVQSVKFWLSLSYYDIMIHMDAMTFFLKLFQFIFFRDGFGCSSFVPGLMFVLLPKVLRTCDFVMAGIFWPLDQVSWSFCTRTTFASMYSVSHLRFYFLDFYSCST